MNELLNYLNNYTKKRKNKHRFSAVMVCLAVIVSFTVSVGLIEPAESASGELICGMEEHEHTQDCFELICGFDDEVEEETAVETTVSYSEETTETTTSTEETTTADTETATTDIETTETIISTYTDESAPVSVHVHSDECYRLICLTEAHLHKQDCYNQPAETEPATTEISTSASTSTGTDTTTSTEQTTETSTTTTELSEEIYEPNAALFGELYKDRVNILADETEEAGYKFYYTGGEANQLYAHDYFTYHNTATGEPTKNIVRTYNGNTYSYAYNFNGVNSNRYVSVKTESNGVLILIFGDGDNFKVKVLNEATNQSTEKEFKSGDDGIMVVPVVQGVNYKVTQSGGTTKARLVYAEFVPAVTPKNDRIYRIRDAATGLYLGVTEKGNGTTIKTGQYNAEDRGSYFKFISSDNGTFQMYPQLDYSDVATQMVDCSGSGNIQTYDVRNDYENNRKHSFISNGDGTFKIKTTAKDNNTYYWKVENEQVIGDTIVDNSGSFILEEEIIDTSQTYLIKNVRSGYYLHREDVLKLKDSNDSDKDNNKNEEIEISAIKTQIIQKNEVGSDSQFKFIPTGSYNEFYIVSADEIYAFTTERVSAGTLLKYSAFERADNQKFHVELLDDGTYRIYQIDETGEKFYIEISDTALNDYDAINDIRDINENAVADIAVFNDAKRHQQFYLFPVTNPVGVSDKNRRVEARVIFGDYNDGKITINGEGEDVDTRIRYDDPLYVPTFNLMYGSGDKADKPYQKVDGELVIDRTKARKDWCYQYNYVWDLGNNTDSYYIKLDGVTKGNNAPDTISFGDKTFNVYYLVDTYFGHPGNYPDSVNAPTETYPINAPTSTDDQIVYIFLDLVEKDIYNFNLSFKKRWDGYNENGYKNRPLEKIRIQLQRLKDGKWVEYKPADFGETYDFTCDFQVISADGKNKKYVHKDAIGGETELYRILTADGTVDHYETRNADGTIKNTYSPEYFNYETLSKNNPNWLTDSNTYKVKLHLEESEWNNIVITYNGENNPTHFTNGYYFSWGNIPKGSYRVVETQSFYDADDNNVFDTSKGDRDTSSEYYYMSFPPSRETRGVLHIQNFTKDMVLDIQKKWYDDTGTVEARNPGKTVKVNIYRSLEKIDDPKKSDFMDGAICSGVEVTNDNIILKTTGNCPELLLKNENDQKYYYYIQEVKVDGYLLKNGNDDGFVKNVNGNFYVDYEDGDGRKFIIENKAKIGIKLNKEWYDTENDANNNTNKMTFAEGNEPNAEFEIYKSDRLGTPLYSNGEFKVEYGYYKDNHYTAKATQTLTHIADAKIDKNGQFEIYSGEENKGEGTSKVISDQLHIFGDEEVFNGTKTFNADATTKGVFEPQKDWDKENDYYMLPVGSDNRLYVKPRHGFGGILELTFEKVQDTDHIRWFDGDNKYLNEFDDYESGKDLVVTYPMDDGDNKYICRTGVEGTTVPRLKSAVFYPYNYYYIREKTGDTCELINGDSNGFVVLQDTNKYYLNLSADSDETRFPIVTAKNVPKVNLDITKKWHNSKNEEIAINDKSMRFQIYTAYQNITPQTVDSLEKYTDTLTVKTGNNNTSQIAYKEGGYYELTNGSLNIIDLPAFKIGDDQKYHKLYYYVREVDGNYTITNTNAKNGFIPYESEKYGTAYDDTSSNSGKYNFVNKPEFEITVKKTWLREDKEVDLNKASMQMNFRLYRTTNTTNDPNSDNLVGEYVTENRTKLIQNLDAYDSNGKKYNYYIVEISSDGNYYVDNYIVTYSVTNASWDKYDEYPVINVTNQAKPQNYELPKTGGSGTHGYTAAGGTVVLLSAAVLLLKRRKKTT